MQIEAQIHTFNSQITAKTAKFNRIMTASEATLSDRQRQYQDKKLPLWLNSKKLKLISILLGQHRKYIIECINND
ncbi:hypothetical protein [Nostoc sp.]|uniref:hypothetical protein n=1 Tax=Nostoc sp. TaxID=1180 RepID=UPI002FFC21C9